MSTLNFWKSLFLRRVDGLNAAFRPLDDLCTCVGAACGYSARHVTPGQSCRSIRRETYGRFVRAVPPLQAAQDYFRFEMATWTYVSTFPQRRVIMTWKRARLQRNKQRRGTKLAARHVKKLSRHSHVRSHTCKNTPSCGSELIPPAVLPLSHTHTHSPLPSSCVPPSPCHVFMDGWRNNKRWPYANEHKYGNLIHGRQIEVDVLDLFFVALAHGNC